MNVAGPASHDLVGWASPARTSEPQAIKTKAEPSCPGDRRSKGYADASRPVLPGGGSVPGTPPSLTCSVHAEPDQYRCSCRPEGSVSQPGAIPMNVASPDDASMAPDTRFGDPGSVNELVGDGPLCRPRRCLWDESARRREQAEEDHQGDPRAMTVVRTGSLARPAKGTYGLAGVSDWYRQKSSTGPPRSIVAHGRFGQSGPHTLDLRRPGTLEGWLTQRRTNRFRCLRGDTGRPSDLFPEVRHLRTLACRPRPGVGDRGACRSSNTHRSKWEGRRTPCLGTLCRLLLLGVVGSVTIAPYLLVVGTLLVFACGTVVRGGVATERADPGRAAIRSIGTV